MTPRRQKKIEEVVCDCLKLTNEAKFSREELVVFLAQMLIRSGYSIHWGYENPRIEAPEKVNKGMINDLYMENPSTGTTLMKIGFDLQEELLHKI